MKDETLNKIENNIISLIEKAIKQSKKSSEQIKITETQYDEFKKPVLEITTTKESESCVEIAKLKEITKIYIDLKKMQSDTNTNNSESHGVVILPEIEFPTNEDN